MDLWNSIIRPAFSNSVEDALKARYDALSGTSPSSSVGSGRDGGIAFPSLEGALLSLAFLTFAVFLVDLIQTLITRLRGGTNVMLTSPAAMMGRKVREVSRMLSDSELNEDTNTIHRITSAISANENAYAQKIT